MAITNGKVVQQCSFTEAQYLVHKGIKEVQKAQLWKRPDWIVAISGGGLIPARIVRTAYGSPTIPIYTVAARSYLEEGPHHKPEPVVEIYQWLDSDLFTEYKGDSLTVLVVDDIHDTGETARIVMNKLEKELRYVENAQDAHAAMFVLHEKTSISNKKGKSITRSEESNQLQVCESVYYACEGIPNDTWMEYQWEKSVGEKDV